MTLWGGLDLARRLDHSALIILELDNGVLHQVGEKIWGHVDYSVVFNDIENAQNKHKMNRIGYDRNGVGDGLEHLMKPKHVFYPIITTNQSKVQMINLLNGLIQKEILRLQRGTELEKEMSEQELDITDAGNIQYRHPSGKHDDLFWALCYACYTVSPYLTGFIKPKMSVARNDFRDNLDEKAEEEIQEELMYEI